MSRMTDIELVRREVVIAAMPSSVQVNAGSQTRMTLYLCLLEWVGFLSLHRLAGQSRTPHFLQHDWTAGHRLAARACPQRATRGRPKSTAGPEARRRTHYLPGLAPRSPATHRRCIPSPCRDRNRDMGRHSLMCACSPFHIQTAPSSTIPPFQSLSTLFSCWAMSGPTVTLRDSSPNAPN